MYLRHAHHGEFHVDLLSNANVLSKLMKMLSLGLRYIMFGSNRARRCKLQKKLSTEYSTSVKCM